MHLDSNGTAKFASVRCHKENFGTLFLCRKEEALNINQLRMVLALAESGSMTVTAKKMHVTQPALTYQIKNIEKELGFKVFQRSHTGTMLTREGSFFSDELRNVLASYDEAVRLSREFARKASVQQIRVGTNDASRTVASVFLRLSARDLPGTELVNVSCGSVGVYGLLSRGVIDLWSCSDSILQAGIPDDLEFEKLFDVPTRVFLPRNHKLVDRESVKIEDLEGETVFLWPEGKVSSVSDSIRGYIRENSLDIEVLDFPASVSPMIAAQSGEAIAIYDEGFIAPFTSRVVGVPLDWPRHEEVGFAYLASQAERLEPILGAIRSLYQRYINKAVADEEMFGEALSLLDNIAEVVRTGGGEEVVPLVRLAVDWGLPAQQIMPRGLAEGASAANDDMREGRIEPQGMVAAARTMLIGNRLLKSLFGQADVAPVMGSAVIGTVQGDLHEVGKNLVGVMLEAKGIDVVDLGVDVAPERFVRQIKHDSNCNLILVSANRTQSRARVKELIDALVAENVRDSVFLMVGGSAVDDDFAHEVGADAYTRDATEAANVAYELLSY